MKECLRKQISLWTASALLMGGLTACGGEGEGAPAGSSGTPERESEIKIGILIPGSPTMRLLQQAAEAGALLEERFDCHVAVVEAATADAIKSEGRPWPPRGTRSYSAMGDSAPRRWRRSARTIRTPGLSPQAGPSTESVPRLPLPGAEHRCCASLRD